MKDELQRRHIQKLKECLKLDEIVVEFSCEPMPMWYLLWLIESCKLNVSMRMSEFDEGPLKCEMPLSMSANCDACVSL